MFSAVTVFLALSGGLLFEEYFLCSMCLAVMYASIFSALAANTYLIAQLAIIDKNIHYGQIRCGSQAIQLKVFAGTSIDDKNKLDLNRINAGEDSEGKLPDAAYPTPVLLLNEIEKINVDEETGFWFVLGRFVLKYPLTIFLLCLAFLISFTVVFFQLVKYGNIDPDVTPIDTKSRIVYDAIHSLDKGEFSGLGRSNIYAYLETNSNFKVTDALFLEQLNQFQVDVNAKVPSITGVSSMINLNIAGYDFNAYKSFYATAFLPQNTERAGSLIFPLGITDLNTRTYVAFNLPEFQYSDVAKKAAASIESVLSSSFKTADGSSMLKTSGTTGSPAEVKALYESLAKQVPVWVCIMMLSVFVLLTVMTNSIIIPFKAIVMSLLSIGATFGIIVLLFTTSDKGTQIALGFKPNGYLDGSNLIFIFSIAFGLSVDYELFLINAIQEEYSKGYDLRSSIIIALSKTGGLITSASLMLAITTFAFLANEVYFMKVIGVGTAIAVILDATLVRMFFVPTALLLMGEWNWYCPLPIKKLVEYIGLQEISLEPLEISTSYDPVLLSKNLDVENGST